MCEVNPAGRLKYVPLPDDKAGWVRDQGVATFYEVRVDAAALLRAMKEYHERHNPGAPFSEGTRLAPYLVAERAGLDPDTLRYERAVRHLVREGVLVWEERVGTVPGIDFYRFTGNGVELLREA